MTDWRWSESSHRYIDTDTGRFISHTYVLDLIGQSLRASVKVTDTLAGYVGQGQINVSDWTNLMRAEIKGEYIRQYLAGIGGRSQMTQADWGKIGGNLKQLYTKYLDPFARELPNLSESQIRVRSAMYIENAGKMYQEAHAKVALKWGADTVEWVLGETEHCELCLEWARMGPQPIGKNGGFPTPDGEAFPRDGSSCLGITKCGCGLSLSNSKTGETFEEE